MLSGRQLGSRITLVQLRSQSYDFLFEIYNLGGLTLLFKFCLILLSSVRVLIFGLESDFSFFTEVFCFISEFFAYRFNDVGSGNPRVRLGLFLFDFRQDFGFWHQGV